MADPARAGSEPLRARVALVALYAAALWAFAVGQRQASALVLLAPALVALAVQWRGVPDRLRIGAIWILRGTVATLIAFGVVWTLYPVLPPAAGELVPRGVGWTLAALAPLFLLGSAAWPIATTMLPASLGTLLAAAFDPLVPIGRAVTTAAVATLAYLWITAARDERARDLTGRLVRVAVFGGLAAGIAIGVVRLLPWAQPLVEASVADLLESQGKAYSGFSGASRLGDIQQLSLSQTVVLRVFSQEPRPLRAGVFTDFDGTAWHAPRPEDREALPLATTPAVLARWMGSIPGRAFAVDSDAVNDGTGLRTRINGRLGPVLFAPAHPRLVRAALEHLGVDRGGILKPPPGAAISLFGVVSGGGAPGELTQEERAAMLAVPQGFAGRVADLVARLGQGAGPGARVARTLGHLGRECRYSLEASKPRTAQPVADFLLETKQGYCEYFASAAALLLRLQGVPTRYVTGFNVRDESRSGGHYVVRESDAHAWIEAWLPGRGWVELDPTPGAQYSAVHGGRPGLLASVFEWLRGLLVELSALIAAGDLRAVARWLWEGLAPWLAWAALAGAAWAVWRLRRGAPSRSRSVAARPAFVAGVPPELVALQSRLDRLWSRHGASRPSARAPREHVLALPEHLPGELREASLQIVDCYYRARFGGHLPAVGEIDRLSARLTAAARAARQGPGAVPDVQADR